MSATPPAKSLPIRRFSTPDIMLTVLVALAPAIVLQFWFAGAAWALTLFVSCSLALLLEAVALRLRGRQAGFYLQDGSVLVTAVLLSLLLPASVPWWLAACGIAIAVIAGKQLFGGLGQNLFNPVLVGYLGLLALFPVAMASYDAGQAPDSGGLPVAGQTLGLLIGGFYLLLRRIISWHIPATLLLTTGLLFYVTDMALAGNVIMLAAFFLATDPVTSPGTRRGKLVYGMLIGVITTIMVNWLTFPAAVAAAILIMNAAVPTLDQFIKHDGKRSSRREQP